MKSRDDILKAVARNSPSSVPLPILESSGLPDDMMVDLFVQKIGQIGGEIVLVNTEDLDATICEKFGAATRLALATPADSEGMESLDPEADPHELASLDVLVCHASIGVAENGAVWITDSQMGQRAAPFLTEHLVVVLDRDRIVRNMHDAYEQVTIDAEGFGLFIAGPSKTADIEQSLVIGAHGPKRHTVLIHS